MSQLNQPNPIPKANPVELTAAAVNHLVRKLPSGTAYCIAIVFMVMMTGRLVSTKGSLALAVLPFVHHLKWGWHRVERAMERGRVSLDGLFDQAYQWCLASLAGEPVYIGSQQREVNAVDSSTIARWRAKAGMDLLGKGYYHRAGKAVQANIIAVVTTIVFIAGIRVGLVRRVRFGTSCEAAVAAVFDDLPKCQKKRLLVVDAGIATQEQFAAATEQDALAGRLRKNCKLRCAPVPKGKGKRGRPPKHGTVLHPGSESPEREPDEDFTVIEEEKAVRVRRWNELHFEDFAQTILDVVRVDDPDYDRPLLIGTTARELTSQELRLAYSHRSPVETNFFVAQDTAAMEMPRAWTENAIKRRIGLALLAGCLLKAIAAVCEPLATGPWDKKPQATAGRLSHHLNIRVNDFSALALKGVPSRNYRKIQKPQPIKDLPLPEAA